MGEHTTISWCDHTFNAWIGCEKVSAGCKNCYASVDTYARVSASRGLPLWGPGSTRHVTSAANWRKPNAWNRAAERDGVRRRVFCSSLSDVFEDRAELDAPRERLFALIESTPHLDWLLLTKRPEHVMRLAPYRWRARFPGNVWMGTTTEDQAAADERIPDLFRCPAAVYFASYEPAIGPVDFSRFVTPRDTGGAHSVLAERALSWIIVGGESGPAARPHELAWARSAIKQCRDAGTRAFFKQAGSRPLLDGEPLRLADRKGGDLDELPSDLHVREWPEVGA